jgi:DNA-3-methyladenine glycosylase
MTHLTTAFFAREVTEVARDLIGVTLLVDRVGGIIVETEAYGADDPASHSFRGLKRRNAAIFNEPGRAYVYRSHGLHWCLNTVCTPGHGVLIRALEPTHGLTVMRQRRGVGDDRLLCAGPGRLCEALGIDERLYGAALDVPPFRMLPAQGTRPVVATPRIGLSRAIEVPWRFVDGTSRFLSRRLAASA